MQYRVEILPTAWEALKHIEDYYLLKFNLNTVLKVTDNILDSIKRLEMYPDSGTLTPDKWLNQLGYRMVICEKQVSIYKIIDKAVYVYHVFDTRSDYTKLFRKV